MEKLNVSKVAFERKVEFIEHILDNMKATSSGKSQAGFMLGGDPGVGKTSFVRDLAEILGLKLITVETPHLVEEHIINIPFIVFDKGGESKKDVKLDTQKDFEVKLAKSSLFAEIESAKKVTDSTLLTTIAKRDEYVKIFEAFDGGPKQIPDEFNEVRSKYTCILFLDEYFRQTTGNIRNMLRSILNGRIGSHELPKHVYVIYASNLNDEGMGEILTNEDFKMIEFEAPSADEWFAYLVSKFKKDEKVQLKDEVVNTFYKLLKDEADKVSLSHEDLDTEVRMSPRRWEQLLLYVNSSLPVKDEKEAKQLLTNVEVNFRHYQTGDKHQIVKAVMRAVTELIKETSKFEVSSDATLPPSEWRDTLKHQIEQKIKLGNHRKYVPVISGLPGTGKTSHIKDLAIDLVMVPVFIDVQNLSPEDVIGLPLSKETAKEIEVKFSRPPLLDDIDRQIRAGESQLKERLEHFYGDKAKEKLAEYKKKEFKYLIFFDELNRSKTKVFNAIRRVILEKSFGDDNHLPEGSVIVAAINPSSNGTQELTKHLRDVLDIIPTGLSWSKFKSHFKSHKLENEVSDPQVVKTVETVFDLFVEKFRAKDKSTPEADPHFFLSVGSTPAYFSPREYNDMLVNAVHVFDRAYKKVMKENEREDFADFADAKLREALFKTFSHTLNYTLKVKHAIDVPEFMSNLEEWFKRSDEIKLADGLFTKKVKSVKGIEEIFDSVFDHVDANLFDDMEFINYINAVEPQKFKEDLEEFLRKKIEDDIKHEYKILKEKKLPKKVYDKDSVKIEKGEVSKLEFVTREIVHAIKIHKLSNNMLEAAKTALRQLITDIANDEAMLEHAMPFNAAITKLIREI